MKKCFAGIFPALLTLFNTDGSIDYPAIELLIESSIKKGVNGFYICGSTGDVFLLSEIERRELMCFVKKIVGDRVTLIAHCGAISTDEVIRLAILAEKTGYDAISAVAPFYYNFTSDEICTHYRVVANSVSIPTLLYNIPVLSGVTLNTDVFKSMLGDERFCGVKHTSGDFFQLEQLRRDFPNKIFYNGYDEMFLSGMIAGADGGIGSTYNVMAEKFIAMYNLYLENRIQEAQMIQHSANRIIELLLKIGVNSSLKAILQLRGIGSGHNRMPFKDCSPKKLEMLEKEVLPLLDI